MRPGPNGHLAGEARSAARLGLAVVAGLLAGCITIPPITAADRALMAAEGREVRKALLRVHHKVDSPTLEAYLSGIGQELLCHLDPSPARYTFEVVIENNPNAFALPGGHVFLTTGAFKAMKSEAQLASVLGHEIGHLVADHAWRGLHFGEQNRQMYRPRRGAGVLDVVWAALLGASSEARYSREMEAEADRLGIEAAYGAGYDPRGLKEFLAIAERASGRRRRGGALSDWFSTHPPYPERAAAIDAHIAQRGMQLEGLRQGRDRLMSRQINEYLYPALEE